MCLIIHEVPRNCLTKNCIGNDDLIYREGKNAKKV